MQFDCCQFGSRLLIALALVSLAIGPSPAAATAMLAASVEQSEPETTTDTQAHDCPEPSSDPAEPSDNGGMTTSYVAPASAKPHDSKETVRPENIATASVAELIVPPQRRACSQRLLIGDSITPPGHLPCQPNAPPALG